MESTQKKILLVEDEAIIAMTEKMALEKYGYAIQTAATGEKAVEVVNASSDIDLVLMDINLGAGIDGTEAAGIILKDHDIPIVFVSSHTEPEIVEKTEKITSYGYVVKNSSITVLDASIKMAFKLFYEKKKCAKRADALRRVEERILLINNSSPDSIYSYDNQGRFTSANNHLCKLLGLDESQIVGHTHAELGFPADLCKKWNDLHDEARKTDTTIYAESTAPVADGTSHYFMVTLNPLHDTNGIIIGIGGATSDITERKQIEITLQTKQEEYEVINEELRSTTDELLIQNEELLQSKELLIQNEHRMIQAQKAMNESRERLAFALEVSGLGEWELDMKTSKIHRNARWAEMLGYSPSEIDDSFSQDVELQHPDDREAVQRAVKDYHEGLTEKFKVTYRMRTKDGKYKWVQDCGKIIERDETGNPVRLSGTQADIDDQKKFEIALQARNEEYEIINEELRSTTEELQTQNEEVVQSHELLRQSESRLLQAESAARIGHWALQLGTQSMIASKGAEAIYGVDFQGASFAEIQKIPLPEYRGMLDKALSDLVTRNIPYDLEFKIQRQNDGTIAHLHSVATFDEKTNTVFGVIQDISAQKKAEEALEKSVESLSFVLDASSLGYSDNDFASGRITRNERWAEMLGYTLAEINKNNITVKDLIHPDDYEEIERITREHLEGKTDYYRMKYRLRTKQGQYTWILDCGKVVTRSSDGKPVRACGTHQDITEEKGYEKRIEKLLVEKELLLKEVHHRIKNNMNTISSLLSLQAGSVKDVAAVNTLNDARNRIQSLTLLYDKLYQSPDYTELAIKEYISSLVDEVVANFPNGKNVKIEKHIDDFVLDVNRLQPLGIMINEVLTNIMKYAFLGRETGVITVHARNVDGHVTVVVQDNGIGTPASVSFENSTGFGLQLVYELAQQLNGTIRMERDSGTKVVLEFKA